METTLSEAMESDDERGDDVPTKLVPLTHFRYPPEPAEHFLRRVVARVRRVVGQGRGPYLASGELDEASAETRGDHMAQATCAPVLELLDAELASWMDDAQSGPRVKLVVIPPGDNRTVIQHWAEGRGLDCLEPPARRSELIGADWQRPELDGDGLLVIAMLERWYLRHAEAVGALRDLLKRLAHLDRRVLVVCNMWAWRCFEHTLDARSFLPAPVTFPAFDAHMLRRWLLDLTKADGTSDVMIKEAKTGDEVLALGEDREFISSWLPGLSALSLGIPWVAWSLWKGSLRTRSDAGDFKHDRDDVDDESTLWVVPLPEVELPERLEKPALLLLHSVLLHGGLFFDELELTLPDIDVVPLLHALQRSNVIELEDKRYVVSARRYPEVHTALENAGLEMMAS